VFGLVVVVVELLVVLGLEQNGFVGVVERGRLVIGPFLFF